MARGSHTIARGTGPAIVLLHGGGGTRHGWHKAGYVARLRGNSTVIAPDLCGYGRSNLSIDPAAYTTDRLGQDILTVAKARGIERFIV